MHDHNLSIRQAIKQAAAANLDLAAVVASKATTVINEAQLFATDVRASLKYL